MKAFRTIVIVAVLSAITIPAVPHIEEDNPMWDCRTMGNHICGPGH